MAMWTNILLSPWISEEVTPLLINVVGSWPQKNLGTSDGDKTAVFSLTATLVMWKILQGPCCPQILTVYFPRLFVHLLFQTYFSTLYMTEDVHTFWKECQEQHGLSTSPNRFAVQTLKALLCSLHLEHVVVAMERKRGWDTLLCADTHHYAVGLLARVMRRASAHLCKGILSYLLEVLSKPLPHWDVSAMAFLVELLDCLDLSDCGDSLMEILYKYLWYNSTEMHHQVLRALLLLKDRPSMAERIQSLTGRLVHLLWDLDSDVARMSIALLSYIFMDEDTPISWRRALQLAEPLLKLLDNPHSQVQLLSMSLLRRMMSSAEEEGRKPLKERVYQSLLPLFFHCQDENRHVAEASRTTLLRAAGFLKRPDLEKAVRKEKLWKFAKLVLADHRIPLAQHLRRALQYLQDPQETLRAAAIRVIGMAGEQLRGQQAELQVLCRGEPRQQADSVGCRGQLQPWPGCGGLCSLSR
ncbi:uncharacterized protein LOC111945851 [Cyanistes caeruleus]|uniref:uncharacterized protein LOC111945851 n=1 Tax=Cyanistes caeruleus TaxID=156563 RepID=UPI000CDA06CF|nr:uncharacterized protein LOC111945851 [Cyanistes caeruleus]